MVSSLLPFFSHVLFIYVAHYLLSQVVDWSRLFKGTAENKGKIQLLLLFFAIGLGYVVSTFFLDILFLSRTFGTPLTP